MEVLQSSSWLQVYRAVYAVRPGGCLIRQGTRTKTASQTTRRQLSPNQYAWKAWRMKQEAHGVQPMSSSREDQASRDTGTIGCISSIIA